MRRTFACLAVVVASAGCGGESSGDGIVVVDAWTRPSPATVDSAALYVTLRNDGDTVDQLVSASSDRCGLVQPHVTVIDDDIASMAEAIGDQLEIPPGERLVMEPNGFHLMCLGLVEPFELGDELTVDLVFAGHPPLPVTVTVDQR